MKKLLVFLLISSLFAGAFAQEKETYLYAEKDTHKLYMDVYIPEKQNDEQSCLMFVFGGGFIGGKRDDSQVQQVWRHFTEKGYVVIAIDYRLGMRGKTEFAPLKAIKNFQKAIDMAAEDVISALDYTIRNLRQTDKFTIDCSHIIVMGSSAGAIAALQADYAMCNGYLNSDILPHSFRIAGIAAYAGAIFSTHGVPKYKNRAPAPTLLCHGTDDKLVVYNKTQFANIGFFGSSSIAKQFKKKGYTYQIRRYTNLGHQVATFYNDEFDIIEDFITKVAFTDSGCQLDETRFDPRIEPKWNNLRVQDLKKFQQ
jgi:predicted esterase